MDKMDKKKTSLTKRSIRESTDNKKKNVKKNQVKDKKQEKKNKPSDDEDNSNQGGNQSFCEDQKDSKNIICEKDSERKSLDDDGEGGQSNKKKKNSQEQNNDISGIDSSIDDKLNQKKVHVGNNINLHKKDSLNLSVNDDSGQKQRGCSDIDSSFDDKLNQKKVLDGNKINLHEKDSLHLPVNDDSKGQRSINKNKNSQKQRGFPDIDSSIDSKLNQKKVDDKIKINLHEKDSPHLSLNDDSKGRSDKKNNKKTSRLNEEQKSHKNVQKPSKWSQKGSIDDNMKQAHDRKNIDSHKDTVKSEESEKWKDKCKNNNGQKQSRFSDACVLEEIDEDIFKLSKDYSLAHCVAEDLRMGAGIAVDFKNIFGGVGKLVDQKLKIGDVGIVKRHDQYAFYLITKKTSTGKPSMTTMEKALNSLLNKMKEYNLTKLGIPTIGCGLDRLDWSDTKSLINKIFSGSGIHITVCVPSKLLDSKAPPRLKVYITPNNLWEMEAETIIILFIDLEKICNKNWTDPIVDKVDAKYPFKENLLRDVRNKKPDPGNITIYNVKDEVIICIFTKENTYYGSLENGFKTIADKIKRYKYLAIQSGPIDYSSDNFEHISWIVLISRSVIRSSELWLCGDVKQKDYKVYYDDYCKNVLPMNNSFQYNSPYQKYNRYNDDRHSSFNTKETSNYY